MANALSLSAEPLAMSWHGGWLPRFAGVCPETQTGGGKEGVAADRGGSAAQFQAGEGGFHKRRLGTMYSTRAGGFRGSTTGALTVLSPAVVGQGRMCLSGVRRQFRVRVAFTVVIAALCPVNTTCLLPHPGGGGG